MANPHTPQVLQLSVEITPFPHHSALLMKFGDTRAAGEVQVGQV